MEGPGFRANSSKGSAAPATPGLEPSAIVEVSGVEAEAAQAQTLHVGPQAPPAGLNYDPGELQSIQVAEPDARHAPTRRIERDQVQRYVEKYGLQGALPSSSPQGPAGVGGAAGASGVGGGAAPLSAQSHLSAQPHYPHANSVSQAAVNPSPQAAAPSYLHWWLWVAVILSAILVGVLIGFALLER